MKRNEISLNEICKEIAGSLLKRNDHVLKRAQLIFDILGWNKIWDEIEDIYFSDDFVPFVKKLILESYNDYWKSRVSGPKSLISKLQFDEIFNETKSFRNRMIPLAMKIEDQDQQQAALNIIEFIVAQVTRPIFSSTYVFNMCDPSIVNAKSTGHGRINEIKEYLGIPESKIELGKSNTYDIQEVKLLVALVEESCKPNSYLKRKMNDKKYVEAPNHFDIKDEFEKSESLYNELYKTLKYVYDDDLKAELFKVVDKASQYSYYKLLWENNKTFGEINGIIARRIKDHQLAVTEFERFNEILESLKNELNRKYTP